MMISVYGVSGGWPVGFHDGDVGGTNDAHGWSIVL